MRIIKLILALNLLVLANLAKGDSGEFSITNYVTPYTFGPFLTFTSLNLSSAYIPTGNISSSTSWAYDYIFNTYVTYSPSDRILTPISAFNVTPEDNTINFRISVTAGYLGVLFNINYYCGLVNAPTICTDGMTHQFYLDFNSDDYTITLPNGTAGIWTGISPVNSQNIVIVQSAWSSP